MHGVQIPVQSEYEIDAYVTMIGVAHEAEENRKAMEKATRQ